MTIPSPLLNHMQSPLQPTRAAVAHLPLHISPPNEPLTYNNNTAVGPLQDSSICTETIILSAMATEQIACRVGRELGEVTCILTPLWLEMKFHASEIYAACLVY